MSRHNQGVDAESFRGKLYLLVIDKIVIGAAIAVAFFIYDAWKTKEFRHYEDARQETDLGFRRAEYVKDLVPIVLDSDAGVFVRAEVLSALVDTESISPQSAVGFAQQLLLADLLGASRQHRAYVSTVHEGDVLFATVMKVVPAALPSVLNEFNHVATRGRIERARDSLSEEARILNDATGFWIDVFQETVARFDDGELSFLDSEPFLSENFTVIVAIVPTLSRTDGKRWMKREVKALRTIGALRLVQSERTSQCATALLRATINPKTGTESLDFASEVIRKLHESAVVSSELSAEVLKIVLSRENLTLHRRYLGDERSPVEDHFYQAAEYLTWSGGFPQVVEALEPRVIAEVRRFYERIGAAPVESLEYTNYPIEWILVRFLIESNSAADKKPSADAQRVLADLFAMGDDKLKRTGLMQHANCWKGTEPCVLQ